MSITSIFLVIVFVLVLLFVGAIKILNTSAGRIFLINLKMRRDEKERKAELIKLKERTLEQIKDPDEFLELILKMKMGERVNIPLAAFSYIYKNIDAFTIFDKNGNLTIINQADYFEFKKRASDLIKDNSVENKDEIEKIINKEKNKIAENPIEVIEHEDGTFVKKDYVARTIEITKPNDEKILINMDDDSVILENIENIKIDNADKKIDKKEFAKKEQKRETKEKEMEQKVKLLKHEKDEAVQELEKEKEKNSEKEDSINSAIENIPNQEKNKVVIEKKSKEKELELEKVEISKDIKSQIIDKNEEVNIKIKENQEKEVEAEKEIPKVKLTFNGNLTNFSAQIKHNLITDIMRFITLYDTDSCRKFVVYDKNIDCILINTSWFIYKLSLLIINKNERETFINTIFIDIKKGFLDNDFLSQIIDKINNAGKYKFGADILNQEKKDKKTINFRSAKILDKKNKKLYQGTFLYMLI